MVRAPTLAVRAAAVRALRGPASLARSPAGSFDIGDQARRPESCFATLDASGCPRRLAPPPPTHRPLIAQQTHACRPLQLLPMIHTSKTHGPTPTHESTRPPGGANVNMSSQLQYPHPCLSSRWPPTPGLLLPLLPAPGLTASLRSATNTANELILTAATSPI